VPPAQAGRAPWLATHAAHDVWDDRAWDVLSDLTMQLMREAGAFAALPTALNVRMSYLFFAGELRMAAALVDEVAAVGAATHADLPQYGALLLAAWAGQEEPVTQMVRPIVAQATSRGEGVALTLVRYGEAVLANGMGRYSAALVAAERGSAHPYELGVAAWSLIELIEAAARIGDTDRAADALQKLTATTRPCGTDWALGIEARSRGLVTGEEQAFVDAIAYLSRTRMVMELARAHLVYGEWLRRESRRVDARAQLRTAYDMLTAMKAEAFAERARRELHASGETLSRRTVDRGDALTPQERQIARLAAMGRTNPEIGAELFISPRTVEWHLRKVFAKLQVGSRRELQNALHIAGEGTPPATQ
jgi:DNA-binding CsgD family transcriptional regulator